MVSNIFFQKQFTVELNSDYTRIVATIGYDRFKLIFCSAGYYRKGDKYPCKYATNEEIMNYFPKLAPILPYRHRDFEFRLREKLIEDACIDIAIGGDISLAKKILCLLPHESFEELINLIENPVKKYGRIVRFDCYRKPFFCKVQAEMACRSKGIDLDKCLPFEYFNDLYNYMKSL